MGPHYDPQLHQAGFETGNQLTSIFTVRSFEEARKRVISCAEEGYGVIELCGAFGKERARELIDLTGGRVGIGFVEHLPEQDEIFGSFFQ